MKLLQTIAASFAISICVFDLGCGTVGSPRINQILPGTIAAGTQSLALKVAGINFTDQTVIVWNGTKLTTAPLDATTLTATVAASSLATPSTVKVQVQNAPNGEASLPMLVVIAASPLAVSTASLPSGTDGTAYSAPLAASGGTPGYTWSIASGNLPTGLTLSSTTGIISGTPTASGSFTVGVKVQDAGSPAQSVTENLALSVAAPGSSGAIAATALTIGSTSLPAATASQPYVHPLSATGGTPGYTWSIASGSMPAGLTLSPTGILSGTPAATGAFTIGVAVKDSAAAPQTANAMLNLTVAASAPPLVISSATLSAATINQPYNASFGATGGTPAYTWSIAAGSLPAGLTLSPAGVISGTPTAAGTAPFTVSVADTESPAQTKSVPATITVASPALAITPVTLPAGALTATYSKALQATGGALPYIWSITAGSLPAGLTLSPAGVISGTPTAAGTASFTANVADSESPAQTKSISTTIAVASPTLAITTSTLPSGTDGTAYSSPLQATGGAPAYTWSVTGSLPAGLTLAATTGIISGTPSATGTSSFTANVTDNSTPAETQSVPVSITVVAAPPTNPGTTWYIRSDGGTRYSANAPLGQCDGKADVAYGGTGTNQHCAFNDYRYLYDDASYGGIYGGWVIAGGDTVIVRSCYNSDGTTACRIGEAAPGQPQFWCVGGNGNGACSAPPIPAGTSAQHTRILGQNYASCGTSSVTDKTQLTQLFGGNSLGTVVNMQGAQYVDMECIEITRHSQCITHGQPSYPSGCQQGVDDYDSDGVATDVNTHDLLLQDMWIHGHTDRGIIGPIGGTVTCLRCDISYNGMAGWDFDNGQETTSPNGVWNFLYSTISWNGCNQEYPLTDKYPAISCYGQSSQGYGDGVGTPPGFCMNVVVDHSTFAYNTQDGIDLGHFNTVGPSGICTLSITNSSSYGNNGASFKWGPAPTSTIFTNNLAEGNCTRMSVPIIGAPSTFNANLGDFCRAGDNLSFDFFNNSTLLMANNTIVSYAPTTFDVQCNDPTSCANSVLTFENNITIGYDNPYTYNLGGQGGGPGGFCIQGCNSSTLPVGTVTRSNNIFYGIRGLTCPTGNPNETCASPLLVNQPTGEAGNFVESELDNYNINLTAGSPAVGAGLVINLPILALDYNGVTRPNPPSIGAVEP